MTFGSPLLDCQKQNSDISRQNLDIYYSIRIIYCNIPLLIKLILGGFNHEAKKYVKKGNVGMR